MRALPLALLLSCLAATAAAKPILPGPIESPPRGHSPRGPATAPSWAQLTPKQQADLAWLERDWDNMPPQRRARILHRWERWQGLPPEEQRALREGRRNYREMSPRQREHMRESWRKLRELPPEEQQRLRALWRGMTPEQRREWLRRGGPGVAPPPAAAPPAKPV